MYLDDDIVIKLKEQKNMSAFVNNVLKEALKFDDIPDITERKNILLIEESKLKEQLDVIEEYERKKVQKEEEIRQEEERQKKEVEEWDKIIYISRQANPDNPEVWEEYQKGMKEGKWGSTVEYARVKLKENGV